MYVDATVPELAFGEYWDTCSYTDGVLNYNQDTHRQRTVNWVDSTGGTCAAFDFTTKGILQARPSPFMLVRLMLLQTLLIHVSSRYLQRMNVSNSFGYF